MRSVVLEDVKKCVFVWIALVEKLFVIYVHTMNEIFHFSGGPVIDNS